MNKKIFVDANIFLRYLINDNISISDKIEEIFKKASSGKILLITNSLVIVEIIFVLESYYDKYKKEIEAAILKIINTKGLEVKDSGLILDALNFYLYKNIDFVDAYNAFFMKEYSLTDILTLDKKRIYFKMKCH
ncbi:MAG: type II toxin-antitoxin system VapC family toxin [Candidatus Acididesulfobacter diazotrophicus]|jgi:predicted nucleic-acid-binding protein|uniref:Type II toxin-antitoxin system VapC family toxin n=1 Tax=Candidatus Acididesulfobacter diazotrophicus TaxID=2597226 RepID=A0A519BM33_9DELT|nr:MAG: type II toxin-antitoxin system VapC family toxin [Candidatus Acididesulfobacter diazotrophicus]